MKKLALFVLVSVIALWSLSSLQGTLILEASEPQSSFVEHDFKTYSESSSAEWNKTYGGTGWDVASSVVQTSDGGYAIAGGGFADLVKTDSAGNMQWNKSYEGGANSVVQTSDGGYALAGSLYDDFWLAKTSSTGNLLWSRTYGDASYDGASSVVQTSDGGYAIAGCTYWYSADYADGKLVKTDSAGNAQWVRGYGGAEPDYASSLVQTSDGGYAMAGFTMSYGDIDGDFWLVRTNSTGHLKWSQTYGGTDIDNAKSVVQTSDGGYAVAGRTKSFGGGSYDFWLVKTSSTGNMLWSQTYGGASGDEAESMVQTSDGGYALAGSWQVGQADLSFVKTDSAGNMQWNKTYGGTGWDVASSVVQTSDGGYAMVGYTDSYGASRDFWLVKLGPRALTITTTSYGTTSPPPGTWTYSTGMVVSVTAMPYAGCYFDHWELDGVISTTSPISVTMNTDHTLHAIFANPPPIADADGPYTGTEGVTVILFDGSWSHDLDGTIISYEWDFGDGYTGTGVYSTHTYTQDGTYTVTLTVTDVPGATGTDTTTATIDDTEPTAAYSGTPTSGHEPLTVFFTDLSTSYDGITSWEWDFDNNGVIDNTIWNPTHVYDQEGIYTVTLKVYEADGDTDVEAKIDYVEALDTDPVAGFSGTPREGDDPLVVSFTDESLSYDGIISWSWDFGDGGTSSEQNPSHTYMNTGNYTVILSVQEADGDSDTEIKVDYIAILGPVGGIALHVEKFGLLAPFIGLTLTIIVATVATAIYVKRVKHRKEKQ